MNTIPFKHLPVTYVLKFGNGILQWRDVFYHILSQNNSYRFFFKKKKIKEQT